MVHSLTTRRRPRPQRGLLPLSRCPGATPSERCTARPSAGWVVGLRGLVGAAAVLVGIAPLGCGSTSAGPQDSPRRTLLVFAASSLAEVAPALEAAFEAAHPQVDVIMSLAGSQTLGAQIRHGAPADVWIAADEFVMQPLVERGVVAPPRLFARNELVLAVRRARAAEITGLAQLPDAPRVVLGTPQAPIGRYTEALMAAARPELPPDFEARLRASVVSYEPNVRLVRARLELNSADAGIVYATDVRGSSQIVAHALPSRWQQPIVYPIAITAHAAHNRDATAFVEFAGSVAVATALRDAGFVPP